MSKMGMSDTEIMDVWRVVACVLHLGNITFTAIDVGGTPGSTVAPEAANALRFASSLLMVSGEQLARELSRHVSTNPGVPDRVVSVPKACGAWPLLPFTVHPLWNGRMCAPVFPQPLATPWPKPCTTPSSSGWWRK